MNKVILIGNVGKEPTIKQFPNGKLANVTLATTERGYTTKDGKQIPEQVEWHNLVFNGNHVNVVEKYVKKGDKLYIEGKIRTRNYKDVNGNERQIKEIVVSEIELLSQKQKKEDTQQENMTIKASDNNTTTPLENNNNNGDPNDLPF